MYDNFFIHSIVDRHLGCFDILSIVKTNKQKKSATAKTGLHVSFWILVFSGICPVVGLLSHSIVLFLDFFSFLKTLHTILHSGFFNLYPQQQCKKFPLSPHSFQHLLENPLLILCVPTLQCLWWRIQWSLGESSILPQRIWRELKKGFVHARARSCQEVVLSWVLLKERKFRGTVLGHGSSALSS